MRIAEVHFFGGRLKQEGFDLSHQCQQPFPWGTDHQQKAKIRVDFRSRLGVGGTQSLHLLTEL